MDNFCIKYFIKYLLILQFSFLFLKPAFFQVSNIFVDLRNLRGPALGLTGVT